MPSGAEAYYFGGITPQKIDRREVGAAGALCLRRDIDVLRYDLICRYAAMKMTHEMSGQLIASSNIYSL